MGELYKITGPDGRSCHGGTGLWRLNHRRAVRGALVPYQRGIHVCRPADLPQWLMLDGIVWAVDCSDERITENDKVVVRWAIPRRRVGRMDARTLRLFACWCVRQVWHLLTDERSRRAVEVAERYAVGEATESDLNAAESAAWSVAWNAAESAAEIAAWSAAESAARGAAWNAAESAARSAAWNAAKSAARSAAMSAAESAARRAQSARLIEMLEDR